MDDNIAYPLFKETLDDCGVHLFLFVHFTDLRTNDICCKPLYCPIINTLNKSLDVRTHQTPLASAPRLKKCLASSNLTPHLEHGVLK
jgi:hypothetical protein